MVQSITESHHNVTTVCCWSPRRATLVAGLRAICGHLAAALFPRYAPAALHGVMDALSGGGPPRFQAAALATLTAWFTCAPPAPALPPAAALNTSTASLASVVGADPGAAAGAGAAPGLRMGPGAVWLLARTDLLSPLTERLQGPLAAAAAEAHGAVLDYLSALAQAAGPRGLRAVMAGVPGEGEGAEGAEGGAPGGVAGSSGVGVPGGSGGQGGSVGQLGGSAQPGAYHVTVRSLYPPPGAGVAAALRRVMDTLGNSARRGGRQRQRMLPYLGLSVPAGNGTGGNGGGGGTAVGGV